MFLTLCIYSNINKPSFSVDSFIYKVRNHNTYKNLNYRHLNEVYWYEYGKRELFKGFITIYNTRRYFFYLRQTGRRAYYLWLYITYPEIFKPFNFMQVLRFSKLAFFKIPEVLIMKFSLLISKVCRRNTS